jgi:hypothetical protein
VDAAWLDDDERARMRDSFAAEFDDLLTQVDGPMPA